MKTMILKFFVLLILLFNFTNCKKSNTDVLYDRSYLEEIKSARKEMSFFLARNMIPGGTVAIAKGGKLIYSEGLGLASNDLEVPVTRSTKFRIGEVSEVITSLLFHKLVEERILHPDSAVGSYIPDVPSGLNELQLRHLLQQTSGIREPNLEEQDLKAINVSLKKGLENFINDSLVAPPGTYQIPGIFNYNLLGVVMEEATGQQFNSLIEKYIADTLGMENTLVDNPFITIKGRSNYFDHNFIAQVVPAVFRDLRHRAPSEGLLSNAEDLVKFGNAILFSDYVTEGIRNSLFEPVELNNKIQAGMTNGWLLLRDRSNRQIYGKSGTVTGGSAALLIYPEEELVVASTINLSTISDDSPVFQMADYFLSDNRDETQSQEQE